jgi:ferredoxin
MLREVVKIDEELCDGCGECIPSCHEGALQMIDGKARLISDLMCEWVAEADRRAAPRAAYLILPVRAKTARQLRVQSAHGDVEFHGAIGEFLGVAQFVVVFVATAGPDVESLASELMDSGDHVPALIVNAVGAERAEAAETSVIERVRARALPLGMLPTLPYSPGYCGMALTEQRTLFDLFGGSAAGVSLTEHCLMQPIKSVSGLVGLGPAAEVQADGTPCDRCELRNCNMRR